MFPEVLIQQRAPVSVAPPQGVLQEGGTGLSDPSGPRRPRLRRRAFPGRSHHRLRGGGIALRDGDAQRLGHGPQLPLGIAPAPQGVQQRRLVQGLLPRLQHRLDPREYPRRAVLRGQARPPALDRLLRQRLDPPRLAMEQRQRLPRVELTQRVRRRQSAHQPPPDIPRQPQRLFPIFKRSPFRILAHKKPPDHGQDSVIVCDGSCHFMPEGDECLTKRYSVEKQGVKRRADAI